MTPSIETPDRGDATAIRTENLTKTYPGVFEAVKSINAEALRRRSVRPPRPPRQPARR